MIFFQCSILNLSWSFGRINLKPIQIEYIWVGVVHLSLGAASHRSVFCERGRNLCVCACVHTPTTDQVLCVELVLGFWSDQSETYTYWIYMGWSLHLPLRGDVDSSVWLWEVSELRSPQHFTNPSDFFQCSILNLSRGFGRINLKPIHIEYIWVGVVHLPLGAASHRPVFCERGRNLAPHSTQHFNDFKWYFFLSWTRLNKKSKARQDHMKVMSRPR